MKSGGGGLGPSTPRRKRAGTRSRVLHAVGCLAGAAAAVQLMIYGVSMRHWGDGNGGPYGVRGGVGGGGDLNKLVLAPPASVGVDPAHGLDAWLDSRLEKVEQQQVLWKNDLALMKQLWGDFYAKGGKEGNDTGSGTSGGRGGSVSSLDTAGPPSGAGNNRSAGQDQEGLMERVGGAAAAPHLVELDLRETKALAAALMSRSEILQAPGPLLPPASEALEAGGAGNRGNGTTGAGKGMVGRADGASTQDKWRGENGGHQGGGSKASDTSGEGAEDGPSVPTVEEQLAGAASAMAKAARKHAKNWFAKRPGDPTRTRPENVVFIKVMKVGGTSLQHLLGRFARERKLRVASPAHLRREGADKRPKVNILSRHCKLQTLRELNFVSMPAVFVTLVRKPLDLAVSIFYWRHQEAGTHRTLGKGFAFLRELRTEPAGQYSEVHLDHIRAFATQNLGRKREHGIYGLVPQFAWFADTLIDAVDALTRYKFLVGLVQNYDQFLIMLRYRLGVPLRSLLTVSSNHYKHPKVKEWPDWAVNALNASSALRLDWGFYEAAESLFRRQVEEFGADKLREEVQEYTDIIGSLKAECDPEGREFFGAKWFLPSCKPGQKTCKFDADAAVACMLRSYDACRSASVFSTEYQGKCERFRHRTQPNLHSEGI